MSKNTTTRKTAARKRTRPVESLPPALVAIARLLDHNGDDEIRAALQAASRSLAKVGTEYPVGCIEDYIGRAARTGSWQKQVSRAFAIDPGNIDADLLNAIGVPAMLAGACFAYLMMGGAR